MVVPVETGYFSLHGLAKMMETLEQLRERAARRSSSACCRRSTTRGPSSPAKSSANCGPSSASYLMESTVNFNTKLKEAASFGQPITEYDPGSRGYKDFVNLARELMGHRPAGCRAGAPRSSAGRRNWCSVPEQLAQLHQLPVRPRNRAVATVNSEPAGPGQRGDRRRSPAISPPRRFDGDACSARTPWYRHRSVVRRRRRSSPPRRPRPARQSAPATLAQPACRHALPAAPSPQAPRTTAQKIDDFYGVKQLGNEVVFAARFEHARQVLIAGDFNNWSPAVHPHGQHGPARRMGDAAPAPARPIPLPLRRRRQLGHRPPQPLRRDQPVRRIEQRR